MTEKISIVYDPSVYLALRKQARFNRGVKVLIIMAGIYILSKEIQKRRIVELKGE